MNPDNVEKVGIWKSSTLGRLQVCGWAVQLSLCAELRAEGPSRQMTSCPTVEIKAGRAIDDHAMNLPQKRGSLLLSFVPGQSLPLLFSSFSSFPPFPLFLLYCPNHESRLVLQFLFDQTRAFYEFWYSRVLDIQRYCCSPCCTFRFVSSAPIMTSITAQEFIAAEMEKESPLITEQLKALTTFFTNSNVPISQIAHDLTRPVIRLHEAAKKDPDLLDTFDHGRLWSSFADAVGKLPDFHDKLVDLFVEIQKVSDPDDHFGCMIDYQQYWTEFAYDCELLLPRPAPG